MRISSANNVSSLFLQAVAETKTLWSAQSSCELEEDSRNLMDS